MPAPDKKLSKAMKHLKDRKIKPKEYVERPPQPSKLSNSLQIIIGETFAPETHNDYLKVAQDVVGIIQTLIPGELPAGNKRLNLELADKPMIINYPDHYLINLTLESETRNYKKFTYQLGHEFGHVMLDPRRSNGMVETLVTLISFEVLDRMAEKWGALSYIPWKNYAPEFTNYRKDAETEHVSHFEVEIQEMVKNKDWQQLSHFMKAHIEEQEIDFNKPRNRDLNWLGTILLRTLPIPWSKLKGLAGLTDPSTDQDPVYRDNLQIVLSKVPQKVLPLFQILGRERYE